MSTKIKIMIIINCIIGGCIGGFYGKDSSLLWCFGLFCGGMYWILEQWDKP